MIHVDQDIFYHQYCIIPLGLGHVYNEVQCNYPQEQNRVGRGSNNPIDFSMDSLDLAGGITYKISYPNGQLFCNCKSSKAIIYMTL